MPTLRMSDINMALYNSTPAQNAAGFFHSKASAPGLATEAYKGKDDLAYALSRVPMLTPRPLKVIAMGAGFGGIALARAVKVGEMPGVDLTIFEKDAGIGGTWYENRYPGYVVPTDLLLLLQLPVMISN